MQCPYCGQEHPDSATSCPITGASLSQTGQFTCGTCENSIPWGVDSCPHCGAATTPQKKKSFPIKHMLLIVLGVIVIVIGLCYILWLSYPVIQKAISGTDSGNPLSLGQLALKDVSNIAYAPSGRWLGIISGDIAKIFDAQTLSEVRTLYADDAILSLAFSPDGEKLAAGLRNGRVQAWNLSNGEVTLSLDWQYNPVLQVAFSADGEILAFTTGGSFIYLSQVEDGTAIERINAIIPQDICLEFSPDGTILASCSSNAVQLWGVSDGSPLTSLGVPAGKPAQLAFSPDGAMVAASSSTGIYLWRVAEGDLQIFGDSPGEGLAFSEDGQNIICGCDGKIEVWDRSNGQLNQTYELGRYRLPGLVFSTADQILVSSLKNGRVRSWKVDLDMSAVPTIPSADDDETTPSVTEVISQDKATATLMEISPSATPLPSHTPPPAHQPIDFKINPVDSADIVLVPAGEFIMGSNPEIDPYFWGAEGPQHEVYLDEYWIYKNEVSTAMYQECEQANACPRPVHNDSNITDQYYGNPQFADYPVLYVSHTHAASYCQWAGGDLPTEAQWEKAARGTNVFLFPWGDQAPTGERANLCDSRCGRDERQDNIDDGYPGPAPIGNFPAGASPYGAMDMAGNAWEWTGDIFDPEYYYVSPVENPTGPASGSRYVIRGGGWNNPNSGVRSVARASLKPNQALDTLGFRCVILSP